MGGAPDGGARAERGSLAPGLTVARSRRTLPLGWRAESEYRAHWTAHKAEHPIRKLLKQPKTPPRELIESLEILADREPQRPDFIAAVKTVRFYITEHAGGSKWLPGYYNPLTERDSWQRLGQIARNHWLKFKAQGVTLQHAAARVAAETAFYYPRMRGNRAERDEQGCIIHDGGQGVPGSSWEAVVMRIVRAANAAKK